MCAVVMTAFRPRTFQKVRPRLARVTGWANTLFGQADHALMVLTRGIAIRRSFEAGLARIAAALAEAR